MPNNIKKVKAELLKRAKSGAAGKDIQQVLTSSVTRNVMRFTPVIDGFLGGGWSVFIKPGQKAISIIRAGQPRTGFTNRSRNISLQNVERIDNITGKTLVVIGNGVYYAPFVNNGTRKQRAQKFRERAVATSIREMAKLGIKVTRS